MTTHELRLGSCLDPVTGLASLASKSIDHNFADPPYEAEAHSKGRRVLKSKHDHGIRKTTAHMIAYPPITEAERAAVSAEIVRVTRRWALVFCQAEAVHLWRACLEAAGAKHWRIGCYRKIGAQPQISGTGPGVGWEAIEIVWCGGVGQSWQAGGKVAVWSHTREGRFPHGPVFRDGQKPLSLLEEITRDFSKPGDLILDPYAGAATTLVACKRLGRSAIGWELDPVTHAKALARLEATEPAEGWEQSRSKGKQARLDTGPKVTRPERSLSSASGGASPSLPLVSLDTQEGRTE